MYQSLTGLQFRKSYQFPLYLVASQLDVATLSSNVFFFFSFVRFRINVDFFYFYLNSRLGKADRRLGTVYMEVGGPRKV